MQFIKLNHRQNHAKGADFSFSDPRNHKKIGDYVSC